MRELREQEGFEFPILLDPEARIIRGWGLLNDEDSSGRLIPHPTAVILDAEGIVRLARTDTDYRVRPPAADLVEALRALQR